MYTQCPDCLTVFSLDAEHLATAGGLVQCAHCEQLFDALGCLAAQLPPEPFTRLAPPTERGAAPRLELAVYRPRPEPAAVLEADTEPTSATEDFSQLVFTPRFARQGRRHRSGTDGESRQRDRRWPWIIVCLALVLLLGGQLAWTQRQSLLRDPAIGGWLRQACRSLSCRLPLVADVDRLHLLARDVEAHPSVPGALMISATFRNDAGFAQPYPVVSLVLADAHGQRVAMRRLHPAEYLDDGDALRSGMAPGATVAVVLEVVDPGNKAVAFEFGFE